VTRTSRVVRLKGSGVSVAEPRR